MNNLVWEKKSLYRRFINSLKRLGVVDTIKVVLYYLWNSILYITYPLYCRILLDDKKYFIYENRKYNYCLEKYNLSWRNERTIEIPIIQRLIKENIKSNILEVGCVLKHYKSSPKNKWIIVDKYEEFEGVINKDITKYNAKIVFDLIVSVSTIEHIGVEDGAIDPGKAREAINYIANNFLKKNGRFIFTIPIGFNKYLDKQIFSNKVPISEKHYLLRVSNNKWLEATKDQVSDCIYNKPFIGANALFIGVIKK